MELKEVRKVSITAIIAILIIILAIIITINYLAARQESQRFYNLNRILSSEGAQIVNHGVYSNKELSEEIGNFTEILNNYLTQSGDAEIFNITLIYGDINDIKAIHLSRVPAGSVSFDFAAAKTEINNLGAFKTQAIPLVKIIKPNQVILNVSGAPISYNLSEGQNFFFIINS